MVDEEDDLTPLQKRILEALRNGPLKFTQLKKAVECPNNDKLSGELKVLRSQGLMIREVDGGPPVRVFYRLPSTEESKTGNIPDRVPRQAEALEKSQSDLANLIKDIDKQIQIIKGFIDRYGVHVFDTFYDSNKSEWRQLFEKPANTLWRNVELLDVFQINIDGKKLGKHAEYRDLLSLAKKIVQGDIWEGIYAGPKLFRDKRFEVKWESLKRKFSISYGLKPENT